MVKRLSFARLLDRFPLNYSASFILLSFCLFVETLTAKTYMLKHSGSYDNFLDILLVSSVDTRFILVSCFISLGLLTLLSRQQKLQKGLLYLYVFISFIFSLTLVAQIVLFRVTGFGLTREYLENFIHYPAASLKMIFSEARSTITSENGRQAVFNLHPRKALESLSPGEYTSAEAILAIPPDWPPGLTRVGLGMVDERRNEYIKPEGEGIKLEPGFNSLIGLGNLTIFSYDD